MTHNEAQRLHDLADYVLLNAVALPSSGLAQGKAGGALALFEAATLLGDEALEDGAFNLLQEALLSQVAEPGWQSGWAGIGRVLLHVIRADMLEADFDELFGEKLPELRRRVNEVLQKDAKRAGEIDPDAWHMVLLFDAVGDPASFDTRDALLHRMEDKLSAAFADLQRHPWTGGKKVQRLKGWRLYLRLCVLCPTYCPRADLFAAYLALYDRHVWMSDCNVGHYLSRLSGRLNLHGLNEAARRHLRDGLCPGGEHLLPLHERLALDYWRLQTDTTCADTLHVLRRRYLLSSPETLEQDLAELGHLQSAQVGVGMGVARLLLLLCHAMRRERGEKSERLNWILE